MKKRSKKLPITIVHTEREFYKIHAGMDVGEKVQVRLTDNNTLHPNNASRPTTKPPVVYYGGKLPSKKTDSRLDNVQLSFFDLFGESQEIGVENPDVIQFYVHGNHEFQKEKPVEPPRFAEYLAYLLPKGNRETLLGDLVETYPKLKAKQGKRRAWFWAYSQVGMSMWSLWGQTIIKWGLIAWLGEMIRKFTR